MAKEWGCGVVGERGIRGRVAGDPRHDIAAIVYDTSFFQHLLEAEAYISYVTRNLMLLSFLPLLTYHVSRDSQFCLRSIIRLACEDLFAHIRCDVLPDCTCTLTSSRILFRWMIRDRCSFWCILWYRSSLRPRRSLQ